MQQLNPAEISNLIKQRIQDLDAGATAKNEGTIVKVSDGIVQIHGLEDAMYGEMIEFEGEIYGMALNLERDSVGAVVLGDYLQLQEGQKAYCTGRILEVPVGPELLGRVVDALGNPIDGKGPIDAKMTDKVEKIAPGVIDRQSVDQPVMTGYKAVDTMIPIGRGQRELIIGDRQTGKTAMAIDAIIAQKSSGIKCVKFLTPLMTIKVITSSQQHISSSCLTADWCEVSRPTARTIVNYRIYDFMTEYTEWIYR